MVTNNITTHKGELSDSDAIERAFKYLDSKKKYLDGPRQPRLEAIQRSENDWIVVLSYLTAMKAMDKANPLWKALSNIRKYKEFEIDAKNGEVLAMRDPVLTR